MGTLAVLLAAGLAAAICQPAARATPLVSVSARGASSGSETDSRSANSGTVTASSTGGFSGFSGTARSEASFGVLRAYSETHAPLDPSKFSINGNASATFADDMTIDASGRTGQNGTFTFTLQVSGDRSVALKGAGTEDPDFQRSWAQANLRVSKNGSEIFGISRETLYANGTTEVTGTGEPFLNRTITVDVPITFGTQFTLTVFLQAFTNVRAQFGADSISDLGNSLHWGGITSVKDSSNNPVANYTASAASGTDYVPAIIPEPASAALIAVGAGVFAARRRRK